MHIAFSALGQQSTSQSSGINSTPLDESEVLLRFKAYEATCEKYKDEILAIQKYIPGWMPAFSR